MPNPEKISGHKQQLHHRSIHRNRYDLKQLSQAYPKLSDHIYINQYGDETIDFFDTNAVVALNKSLLCHYYQIDYYHLPAKYLCPPIPGRADYLHYVADLLMHTHQLELPNISKPNIKCLDIGTGANCIYPILGTRIYNWTFVATDINKEALGIAQSIVEANKNLSNKISLRLQTDKTSFFTGIINSNEKFDLTICNPPFHASAAEAEKAALRKLRNLKKKNISKPKLNFSGTHHELWYPGGEKQFITGLIKESKTFAAQCTFFTSLVSKESNLAFIQKQLDKVKAKSHQTIQMGQGNKRSRIIAWSFMK